MDKDNWHIFDQAIRTAEILVKMFGSNCEVAVHDFRNLEQSLIHISGSVTNRKVGAPITDLVLKELKKPPAEIKDIANYTTTFGKGIVMKSSTVFLRNQKGEIIGALCINFNISPLMKFAAELQDFIKSDENQTTTENFYSSVHDIIEGMVKQAIDEINKHPSLLNMDEKIEVVRKLEEKGAFLIKGAVEYLAMVLGVSKFTIYNYLQKIRTQNEYHLGEDMKTNV